MGERQSGRSVRERQEYERETGLREKERNRGVRERKIKRDSGWERKIGRETGVVERGRQELERDNK